MSCGRRCRSGASSPADVAALAVHLMTNDRTHRRDLRHRRRSASSSDKAGAAVKTPKIDGFVVHHLRCGRRENGVRERRWQQATRHLQRGEGFENPQGEMTMSAQKQQALDSLYAIDNVLTIKITMPAIGLGCGAHRAAEGRHLQLRLKGGAGSRENCDLGRNLREQASRADHIHRGGRQEESFCGSLDSDKPCLRTLTSEES